MSLHVWLRRSGLRWSCALLLALLLPLAQGMAASHAITHHSAPTQQPDEAPSALDATCVQCLLAAPVGAGALPSAPPVLAPPAAVHAKPTARPIVQPASARALAYRSRAPPVSLH